MTSKLAPIILAVFALSIAAAAQTWTFQGTQICYDLGSTVQCYARGTISSFVSQRDRAFESGRQAGQGVGSLAGVLIAAWLNHRQQVKIETEELTKELQAYFDAEFDLIQDEQKMESEDQQSVMELAELNPVRRDGWQLQLQSSKKLYDQRAKYLSDLNGLLAMEMKEKRRKALRYFIVHEPDGAKARYGRQRTMAAQSYVVNQFLRALVSSYRQQPATPQEEPPVNTSSIRDTPCWVAGNRGDNIAALCFAKAKGSNFLT
jgi:hypothetical protein